MAGLLTGCTTTAASDEIGLYYNQGPSDGDEFSHCVSPGTTATEWNNEIIMLPAGLLTWNVGGEGSDTGTPITSSSKPQEGQPSGVEVHVWPKLAMRLNTYCGADGKDGSVVKAFWQDLGRAKNAHTPEGRRKLVLDVVVPPLEKSIRDVTRGYEPDLLVGNGNGVLSKVQTEVAALFTAELKRSTGGDFFCGPSFDRDRPDCPAVELMIKDVTYADPGIQAARNEKQKAVEKAAANLAAAKGAADALIAEADGKRRAAEEIAALYANPAWVRLQEAQIQADAAKACGTNPNCHMVIGANGNIIFSTK